MKKISYLILIPLFILTISGSKIKGQKAQKPNIVIFLADDLGYGDLGCYGAETVNTPNIDRLAETGMVFTDAHSPSAVCTPTRYGILTGRYAWRSWLKNWVVLEHMPLLIEENRETIQSMLQKSGYKTACIGKWHLGWGEKLNPDWSGEVRPGPLETGFDYYFGMPYSHNSSERLQVFVENRMIIGLKEGENIDDPDVRNKVKRKLENTGIKLAMKAIEFINENKNNPFFLYFPTGNIHTPLTPNEQFHGKSGAGSYGDFISEMDWMVGKVVKSLDSLDLSNNTLLIFTSDNGANIGALEKKFREAHHPNGNWRGAKTQIYEGGHRIPFIVKWPGKIKPGTCSDETICLTDVIATCAAITGETLTRNMAEDSYNILPVLQGIEYPKPLREATVHHSVKGMFAIRKGAWKLVDGIGNGSGVDWKRAGSLGVGKPEIDPQTGEIMDLCYDFKPFPVAREGEPEGQLYNLKNDPGETTNLWIKYPEKVDELMTILNEYRNSDRSVNR